MTINLNTGQGLKKRLLFPDNQPHIQITGKGANEWYDVICSITDSKTLLELMMVSNAIKESRSICGTLTIPYLMGARFDRVMEKGDSFDLKVIAEMINLCGFKYVYLVDPHSDKAELLIKNAITFTNKFLVEMYNIPDSVLIIPDLGASKKAHDYFSWNKNLVDSVQCLKERDYNTGEFKQLKVMEPDKCTKKDCVIIDDLCDGGGTFLGIAEQIQPHSLTLIVTHGIFSRGFALLEKKFDKIIVSDSYNRSYNSKIVTVVKSLV